jgi:hypothetical protein
MKMTNPPAPRTPRIIFAVAAESDDAFIWQTTTTLQANLFEAGPIAIKLGYFGRENAVTSPRRPFVATSWCANADDMANLIERGRAGCVCGCYIQINDILKHALQEIQQGPVEAVVIIGNHAHDNLDDVIATAKQLRAAGTRLFFFQQARSNQTEETFRALAEITGGAHISFNPHVERIAERLPGMLDAISHYVVGGMPALEARDDEAAMMLLNQMQTADMLLVDQTAPNEIKIF